MSLDSLLVQLKQIAAIITYIPDYFDWIVEVLIAVLIALLIRIFQKEVFRKLQKQFEHKGYFFQKMLIQSAGKPVGAFIWLMGLSLAVLIIQEQASKDTLMFAWIDPARKIGTIAIISWAIIRFLNKLEDYLIDPPNGCQGTDKTTTMAIGRLTRVAAFITTGLVILESLSIKITGILALGGVGTLILGIASKDLLANFFGGLMIFMDRPFVVGDWIRLSHQDIEGCVEHVGWRLTTIRTFNKRPIYVPNGIFLNIAIENPSRMTNRQIKQVVGLRYQDANKVHVIVEDIEKMLKAHPEIDTGQATFVAFNEFGDSSLNCLVYCFTKTTERVPYLRVQQDILIKIMDIVKLHGGDMAFPTTTVDVPEEFLHALHG